MRKLPNCASSSFSFIYAPNPRNIKELEACFVYLPTTFRSPFAAKFSMQIVNVPMHIVCIPAGHFRCIHLFRTVGDSNPALIIKHFRGKNRACLRSAYGRKIAVRILWAGSYFCAGFFSSIRSLRPSFSEIYFKSSIFCLLLIFE